MSFIVDSFIAVILVISTLAGLTRGFVHEVLSLVVWVVSFISIFILYDAVFAAYADHIQDPQLRFLAVVASVFLPVYLILSAVRRFTERTFLKDGPDSHDVLVGFLFGAFRGVAIVAVAVIIGSAGGLRDQQWWHESWLIGYVEQATEFVMPWLPESLHKQVAEQKRAKITRKIILNIDHSGHYSVKGTINGSPVQFLLDTGASHVSISKKLAAQLNLPKLEEEFVVTASGRIVANKTTLNLVTVGKISIKDVRGVILDKMPDDHVLLGMSFLKRLDFQKSGNLLVLEQTGY